jgi:hypothetical protein
LPIRALPSPSVTSSPSQSQSKTFYILKSFSGCLSAWDPDPHGSALIWSGSGSALKTMRIHDTDLSLVVERIKTYDKHKRMNFLN